MTFDEYVVEASEYQRENPHQRSGQVYFNVLYQVRPDLSERIRTTDLDPFYRDQRLPQFLEFVANNWEVAA